MMTSVVERGDKQQRQRRHDVQLAFPATDVCFCAYVCFSSRTASPKLYYIQNFIAEII